MSLIWLYPLNLCRLLIVLATTYHHHLVATTQIAGIVLEKASCMSDLWTWGWGWWGEQDLTHRSFVSVPLSKGNIQDRLL